VWKKLIESSELIKEILTIQDDHCTHQRVMVRKRAEDTAISIIEEKIGDLEYYDIKNVFKQLDFDFSNGRFKRNRFGQAFSPPNLENGILQSPLELLNDCFLQIYWNENLAKADEFIESISGAGDCLISCILYLKNRDKYKPYFKKLETGLRKVIKYSKGIGSFKERYLVYNKHAEELARLCKLENQELDIILTVLDYDQDLLVL